LRRCPWLPWLPPRRSPLADLELLRPDARGTRQLAAAALLRVICPGPDNPLGRGAVSHPLRRLHGRL